MKTFEGYIAELEELKQQLRGAVFYIALPAAFLPEAKADDHFYMVMPKGVKPITLQKWDEVAGKEDTEVYAMPQLSAKMERLYFENTATCMPEKRWKTIANAAKNHALPEKMNAEDQRLFNYLQQLPKNEHLEFLEAVNNRRMANAELKRQYKQIMAQREAMENISQRKSNGKAVDQLSPPADETPEERVSRISSMIASDFGESFEPFW